MANLAVQMPQVGESVTEAIIAKWIAKPGDQLRKYDPIVEVVTDKVNMEIPAPAAGTLKELLASEGATVAMGAVIANMEVADGDIPDDHESADQVTESDRVTTDSERAGRIGTMVVGANVGPTGGEFRDTSLQSPASSPTDQAKTSIPIASELDDSQRLHVTYSPVVTRLASRHGIDLAEVKGTGRGGRITKRDVERHLATEKSERTVNALSSDSSPRNSVDEVVALSPMRSMIAEHMSRSVREIPHAWAAVEVDMSHIVRFRQSIRREIESRTGHKLTYLPISLYMLARVLPRHRRLNATWNDGQVVLKGDVNIGIAVATESGLVVPVLKNADAQEFESTVSGCARLVNAARENRLTIDDVQGGTFTLNNTGAFGSLLGGAIINHPQAAILNTEAIVRRPVVVQDQNGNDSIGIRPMMNLCLSFDHRILDGADAMAFLNDLKSQFENPDHAGLRTR